MDEKHDFDLQLFLPYLLNQAAEAASLSFQKVYKERYGMLRTEWRVLFHLGMYGQMTARDIGLRAGLHKTKISRAVQRLAERRYLRRERDDADRRSERLDLTPAGRAVYDDLRAVAKAHDAGLVAPFTQDEAGTLRDLLQRLAQTKK